MRPGREIRIQNEPICAPQLRITDEPFSAPKGGSAREPGAKADDGRGAPGGARKGWPPVATCPAPAVQLGSAHQFRDSSWETLTVGGQSGGILGKQITGSTYEKGL